MLPVLYLRYDTTATVTVVPRKIIRVWMPSHQQNFKMSLVFMNLITVKHTVFAPRLSTPPPQSPIDKTKTQSNPHPGSSTLYRNDMHGWVLCVDPLISIVFAFYTPLSIPADSDAAIDPPDRQSGSQDPPLHLVVRHVRLPGQPRHLLPPEANPRLVLLERPPSGHPRRLHRGLLHRTGPHPLDHDGRDLHPQEQRSGQLRLGIVQLDSRLHRDQPVPEHDRHLGHGGHVHHLRDHLRDRGAVRRVPGARNQRQRYRRSAEFALGKQRAKLHLSKNRVGLMTQILGSSYS
jgi:hypothetical protein